MSCFYRLVLARVNSFCIQLCYFLSVSFFGFVLLKVLKPRTHDSFKPRNLDLFFTSVSATTVSSMSTVEMEVFSNSQLIVLTILMLIGGEIFTSMVGLHFKKSQLKKMENKISSLENNDPSTYQSGLVMAEKQDFENLESGNQETSLDSSVDFLKYKSIKFLCFVVSGYFIAVQVLGVSLVSTYLALVSSSRNVLKNKGLNLLTFSIFSVVSTFANCGFLPTNENMVVFKNNSGLLLILIPQILLGNTLFPSCLRFCVWFLGKFFKRVESNYLLKKTSEIGYFHLLPSHHSSYLFVTVFGFIITQFILFCSMEWNSAGLSGLNSYQKTIGILFQTMNTRYAGESIVDLSTISSAILVLFVVMMYLPPYTSFLPIKDDEEMYKKKRNRRGELLENILFSQLSYLAIFIILVCITERQKLKEDPLNFNVLNIVVEVVSAYGSVGFTTGYSCDRQTQPNSNCVNKFYGFSGKWSDEGKIILIVVMVFGRLKKFNMDGGRAWKLL
nr:putative cation transporter HKT6 isoform X2 [Populus alba]